VLKICSQGLPTPWNTTFDNTQVAFWDDQKAEMRFQGHSSPWNIAFSNSQSSFLIRPESTKLVHRDSLPY
jgi:hypothetical protein